MFGCLGLEGTNSRNWSTLQPPWHSSLSLPLVLTQSSLLTVSSAWYRRPIDAHYLMWIVCHGCISGRRTSIFFCLWLVTSFISTTWVYCTTAVVDGTQDWLLKKIKWMYQGFMLVFSWIWKDMHLRPLQLLGDNCHTNVVTLYICWWSHSCVCFILQCRGV
jgi:hypothetical protein